MLEAEHPLGYGAELWKYNGMGELYGRQGRAAAGCRAELRQDAEQSCGRMQSRAAAGCRAELRQDAEQSCGRMQSRAEAGCRAELRQDAEQG